MPVYPLYKYHVRQPTLIHIRIIHIIQVPVLDLLLPIAFVPMEQLLQQLHALLTFPAHALMEDLGHQQTTIIHTTIRTIILMAE